MIGPVTAAAFRLVGRIHGQARHRRWLAQAPDQPDGDQIGDAGERQSGGQRPGLARPGRSGGGGAAFDAVDHRPDQVFAAEPVLDPDTEQMKRHQSDQPVGQQRMQVAGPLAGGEAKEGGQRAFLVGAAEHDVAAGDHAGQRQHQQRHHHRAGRVVAEMGLGGALQHRGDMLSTRRGW